MSLYTRHLIYAVVRGLARMHHGFFPEEGHVQCHAAELSLPVQRLVVRAWQHESRKK